MSIIKLTALMLGLILSSAVFSGTNIDEVDDHQLEREFQHLVGSNIESNIGEFEYDYDAKMKAFVSESKTESNTQLVGYYWTRWFDRDNPSGTGDWETRAHMPNVCPQPHGIGARTVRGHIPWYRTGEKLTVNQHTGLICKNAEQTDGYCLDYEVRFLCSQNSGLIPNMTSSTKPSGKVTSSGSYAGYNAVKGLNSDKDAWLSQLWESPAWIAYSWGRGIKKVASRYSIKFTNGRLTSRAPKAWKVQGFNGRSWVTLDTRSNQTNWLGTQTREFRINSPRAYLAYRLYITHDNDARSNIVTVSIAHFQLYGN